MPLLLGLDTGGTFTDAAILDLPADGSPPRVVAKAKDLTTRHDLAVGLAGAARSAIERAQCDPAEIALVSLSTTLATNALVEGQGGRIALISVGFSEKDIERAGLKEALGNDPVVHLMGGHGTHGQEAASLDLMPLEQQIDTLASDVSGFAVAGYFAVRNPAHEEKVREFLASRTNLGVTCSHELSARLNGPKRALTTVLNARLVPMITSLIEATSRTLEQSGINCPVMVVRGDGALVSADFASKRPIETILSGPAASLVGARFLTGLERAFVCDIGGTTSDVAILEDGRPKLDPDGALVGGFRTMVEAVSMHTFGLGGDSEVNLGGSASSPQVELGPRRLVPVSLVASKDPETVHEALDRQLKSVLNNRQDGRFAFRSGAGVVAGLSMVEQKLFDRLSDQPKAVEDLLEGSTDAAALQRLVGRGLAQVAGLTPSDAMHALGEHGEWDKSAAEKALALFARRRDGGGNALCDDPLRLAEWIVRRVQYRSAEVVLETAFHEDGQEENDLVGHPLVQQALRKRAEKKELGGASNVRTTFALNAPLIGLGASAFQYHPEAARILETEAVVPEHADVANAVGAVVGQISVRSEVVVSQPGEGRYAVTGIDEPFADESLAIDAAQKRVAELVAVKAKAAGADEFEISVDVDEKRANVESRDMLVEASIVAIATGRPPLVARSE